jgi:hypothetical protein
LLSPSTIIYELRLAMALAMALAVIASRFFVATYEVRSTA